jgi:hypothetical protein
VARETPDPLALGGAVRREGVSLEQDEELRPSTPRSTWTTGVDFSSGSSAERTMRVSVSEGGGKVEGRAFG